MDILLYNSQLEITGIIDAFESFIWTDRYNSYGDFEILMQIPQNNSEAFLNAKYLGHNRSEHLMLIENIAIETDVESGSKMTVSGRSIESMLDRRIVWEQTTLYGNLQEELERLFNENAINPADSQRKIENLKFAPTDDVQITSLTIEAQFTGDSLYSVVNSICESYGIGFKMVLNSDSEFVFSLYSGVDRSYNQSINPHVVFSPDFDNLINSDYNQDSRLYKNIALVAGEGDGSERITKMVEASTEPLYGFDRSELYVDARDLSSTTPDGDLTLEEYLSVLETRGFEELSRNSLLISFSGEFDTSKTFVYGTDFFMGDIVQVKNEYGMTAVTVVVELIFSEDAYGTFTYPTFSALIL